LSLLGDASVVKLHLVSAALSATNVSLIDAFRATGADAALSTPEELAERGRPGDVALGRIDVLATFEGVEPGVWELRRAKSRGVRVLNGPATLLAAHDKLGTAIRLAGAGLPHPRTAHVDGASALPRLEFPVVVKPRFGSWGRDVYRCEDAGELAACLASLDGKGWFERHGAIVQELVPPCGFDLRLIVAAGEVVGAIERVAADGEWRTNIALGGWRRRTVPPASACALAIEAAAAIGGDLVGVDLLPDGNGGWVVLELNGAVDFTSEYTLNGTDVFELTARTLTPLELPVAAVAQ
jgi:RimK family alpha-L-glutamate ligase